MDNSGPVTEGKPVVALGYFVCDNYVQLGQGVSDI